jgi:lipoprotein-anchoring transpeptidase ErfK/SrfK
VLPTRRVRRILPGVAAAFLLLEGIGLVMSLGFSSRPIVALPPASGKPAARRPPSDLAARNRALQQRIDGLAPRGIHAVVDTGANRLYLMDGEKVLREAVVSCGSGNVLPNPLGGKDWVFDTPRGEFRVETKIANPTWVRPDWAFIEEGEKIPKKWSDRLEEGVMGEYALGIGRGYFLHGTLYTRLLGRNVTHGCVRLGDADLAALYQAVPIGARVYLF